VKHATWNFAILTTAATADFSDGHAQRGKGHYAIRIFDTQGEDWMTEALPHDADCEQIVEALEGIPNNVVAPGTAICHQEKETNALNTAWSDDQPNLGNVFGVGGITAQDVANAHIEHVGGLHNLNETHVNILNFWESRSWFNSVAGYAGVVSGSVEVEHTDPINELIDQSSTRENSLNLSSTRLPRLSGSITRIAFYGNPGAAKQPEIEIYLDGKRPSLSTTGKLITKVWTDGQQGENNDYFGDHCDGVTVRLSKRATAGSDGGKFWLTGMTPKEKSLFKKCLGSSDFDTSNNVDVQNWDHGNMYYPHIIKLVRTVTSHNDGGYYAAVYFDESTTTTWVDPACPMATAGKQCEGSFRLVNALEQQNSNLDANGYGTDDYDVYTTQGTLALTSNYSQAVFGLATNNIYTVAPEYDFGYDDNVDDTTGTPAVVTNHVTHHQKFPYDGDISCEIGQHNQYKEKYIFHCLNKTDIFTVLNWGAPASNPRHINLYTATRIYTAPADWSVGDRGANGDSGASHTRGNSFIEDANAEFNEGNTNFRTPTNARRLHGHDNDALTYMTHVVNTDISTNWAAQSTDDHEGYPFWIYKFFPARESTYNYVGECSNRGLCNRDSGVCACFPGYTNDDCSQQNALAQ